MKLKPCILLTATLAACSSFMLIPAHAANSAARSGQSFIAHLQPMNTSITNSKTTGQAKFDIRGDKLTIAIDVKGAPPNVTHWQHFHGFKTGMAASCATTAADTNSDGIVDLIETEPASGTTMVPFIDKPASMDVAHGAYPTASDKGSYEYREVVSVKALTEAFAKAFDGQKLDLDKRVVLIHGVPDSKKLPATVQSLGPIPAQVTVPIACGKIQKVSHKK